MIPRFNRLVAHRDRVSASQYNRLVETVERLYSGLLANGTISGAGILTKRPVTANRSHIAYCKDNASASSTIVCYLDVDTTGIEITVNCNISGALLELNTCIRRLSDGDAMVVTQINGTWYAVEGFQDINEFKGIKIIGDRLASPLDECS